MDASDLTASSSDASSSAAGSSASSAPAASSAPPPAEASISLATWWERHSRSPPPPSDEVGRALRLGDAEREAFLSERVELPEAGTRGGPRHAYRALRVASVWVVLRSQPRRVLDLPIAFDVMDKEDLEDPPLFELSIRLDSSDGAILVEEPPARPCSVARRELSTRRAAEREPSALSWIELDTSLVGRVCRSVGRHVWDERTERFVRRMETSSSP